MSKKIVLFVGLLGIAGCFSTEDATASSAQQVNELSCANCCTGECQGVPPHQILQCRTNCMDDCRAGYNWCSTPVPGPNVTGVWSASGGQAQIFHDGDHLSMVFLDNNFAHWFDCTFAGPVCSGVQRRKTLASGCVTRMAQRFTVQDERTIVVDWQGLDSHCDLAAGQVGQGVITRLR